MHPLLDRRDVTAQRQADAQAPPSTDLAALASLVAEVATTNHLLQKLLTNERADVIHLCVSDREPPEMVMDNFPVPGARRLIVRRPGAGGTFSLPTPGTGVLVCAANENRLGGSIVVSGTGAVNLFLSVDQLEPGTATPLTGGTATIFLAASGGAWDFRLGNVLWCGNIIAVPVAATTVTVAEV